jgi:hypothetical protein
MQSLQLNAITKISETLEKFMAGVDQRLEALEKATREILVVQKTQKDFYQQQYNQLLTKLSELEAKEKEKKESTVSYQNTSTSTTTTKPQSSREREKEREKEQELADAQLAAQLQSQLDQEIRSQQVQVQNKEPEELCPLCNVKFPLTILEKHCNEVHFNYDSNRAQDPNRTPPTAQEQSWFTKFFGNKPTDLQQTQQPQQVRPQAVPRTTSSPALPYQQPPYLLAPAYVQNTQGQNSMMYRPGQVPPGYAPANQVYYDSAGNVYNPNLNTSSYTQ